MSLLRVGTISPIARLVFDDNYYQLIKSLIRQSQKSCLVSMFIIDLKSGSIDPEMKVYQLLKLLKEAHWRGVEVKVLIGGSRDNLLIAESAEAARFVYLQSQIECRWLTCIDVRGSHIKMIVSDDFVLAGSHNWSTGAFTNQVQDSIIVKSAALSAYCQAIFYRQWKRSNT